MHLSVIVPTLNRFDTAPLIAGNADLLVAPVREFLYLLGDRCLVFLRRGPDAAAAYRHCADHPARDLYFAAGDVMRCGWRLEL
jgi:hypothetical protein